MSKHNQAVFIFLSSAVTTAVFVHLHFYGYATFCGLLAVGLIGLRVKS